MTVLSLETNQCHRVKFNQSTLDGITTGLQAHRESRIW